MPLLKFLSKTVAVFRGVDAAEIVVGPLTGHVKQIDAAAVGKPDDIVLAVQPPVAFGDVVVGAHLDPSDERRVHQALQLIASHEGASGEIEASPR